MRRNINIKNEALVVKFDAAMSRFGYSTSVNFIEDMITFFETNPVTPKEKFGGLLKDVLNKMDEFNKDNNRVIAVVRKIENDKLNPIYRAVTQDLNYQLSDIKKCVFDKEKLYNNSKNIDSNDNNNDEESSYKESKKEVEKIDENVIQKYEAQIKKEVELYKILEKEYDDINSRMGKSFNNLKKLKSLYSVEKGTFSKSKIVIELSEEEFLELIKL